MSVAELPPVAETPFAVNQVDRGLHVQCPNCGYAALITPPTEIVTEIENNAYQRGYAIGISDLKEQTDRAYTTAYQAGQSPEIPGRAEVLTKSLPPGVVTPHPFQGMTNAPCTFPNCGRAFAEHEDGARVTPLPELADK